MQGRLTVSYLAYSQTYGYDGTFHDAQRARYDFEVNSNQNGGVGGAWTNHQRHRETRIEMRFSGRNFVIYNLDIGGQGMFTSQ